MAIYRTGTASLNAQGVIVGVGTNWQDKLSLVRVGATMIFQTAPLTICTISSIVSPTEMRATATDGAVVAAGTKYVILLHDSITVDGLAQDVAETLRYYQSKETVIEDAIEFFQNFDWERIVAVGNQVKADAQTASTAATNTKTSETNSKASENAAKASQTAAKTSETNAKTSETNAASSKTAAAASATTATQQADRAKTEADRAATANPDNQLKKANNLSDVANMATTRANISVDKLLQGADRTLINSQNKSYALMVHNTGIWGAYRESDSQYVALGVAQGGTGATDVAGARYQLGVPGRTEVGLSATGDINATDADDLKYNGFFAGAGANGVNFQRPYAPGITMRRVNDVYQAQIDDKGRWYARFYTPAQGWGAWTPSLIPGDYGIGDSKATPPTDWSCSFIADSNGSNTWAPSNGNGIQVSYANNRAGQIWVDSSGRLHSRFNLTTSPQATRDASPWRLAISNGDDVSFNTLVMGGVKLTSEISETVPGVGSGGSRGICSGVDSFDFNKASNISMYSWYSIGFCTSYSYPTNGVVAGKPSVLINTRSGDINAKGSVTSKGVVLTSDRNKKTDIVELDGEHVSDLLDKVATYSYRYKEGSRYTAGVIAQELQIWMPQLVSSNEADGSLQVDYMGLLGYMHAAFKDEKAKRKSLEDRVKKLESYLAFKFPEDFEE